MKISCLKENIMKKIAILLVIALSLLVVQPVLAAPILQASPVPFVDIILKLAMGFASLVGVAALVAALINILKLVGLVQDATAGRWSAGINLVAFAALVAFGVFQPSLALEVLDSTAGQIAQILLFVLGYLVQIVVSPATHAQLKDMRIPLIGTSFSDK